MPPPQELRPALQTKSQSDPLHRIRRTPEAKSTWLNSPEKRPPTYSRYWDGQRRLAVKQPFQKHKTSLNIAKQFCSVGVLYLLHFRLALPRYWIQFDRDVNEFFFVESSWYGRGHCRNPMSVRTDAQFEQSMDRAVLESPGCQSPQNGTGYKSASYGEKSCLPVSSYR